MTLKKQLEQRLAVLSPETPLPPMRELMREYRVGTTRLNTIISQMEEEGLLVRKARSGIYKARESSSNISVPFVDVILCSMAKDTDRVRNMGLFTNQLISELTTAISKHGRGCRVTIFSNNDSLTKYKEKILASGTKAAILIYQTLPDQAHVLSENMISWVSLLPKIHFDSNRLIVDSPDRTKLQMEYLLKLGHTRIAYIDTSDPRVYSMSAILWREAYYKIMAINNLEAKEHWVQNPGITEQSIRESFKAMFASKPYPTAVIVRDYDLPIAYRFVETLGLTPGKDVSFIAHDDLPFVSQLHPAATSVTHSPSIAAQMALDTLMQVMGGNEPLKAQTIPLSITERESTSAVL